MEKNMMLEDTARVSDSRIRGVVTVTTEDGKLVFNKENMIVGAGRRYISGLVNGAINGTLSSSQDSIVEMRFGEGTTLPAQSNSALESGKTEYDIVLDTTLVWKKNLSDIYSGTYGSAAPSGGSNGDYYIRTGATSPGLYLKTSGTWGPVSLTEDSYFRSTSDTKVFIYTHSTTSWDNGSNGVSGDEFSDFASPSEGDAFYNTVTTKLYTYEYALTKSVLSGGQIGLRFSATIRGSVAANITELGLFLESDGSVVADESLVVGETYEIKTVGTTNWNTVFGTTGVTYAIGSTGTVAAVGSGTGDAYLRSMFSRLVFDAVPLTDDTDAYNITYNIYF